MRPRRRLRRVLPAPASGSAAPNARHRAWIVVGIGAAAALAIGGAAGVVVGVVCAVTTHIAWGRATPAHVRRRRARDAADLPFGLDVFAACLRAGSPPRQAVEAAAEAVGGGLADRLRRVARALGLGVPPTEAFAELGDLPAAERLSDTAQRSVHSGASLAGGLELLARELRGEQRQTTETAAHRAGVWMVLPLCLCFLPAFVAAGLVPVVASALTKILNTY